MKKEAERLVGAGIMLAFMFSLILFGGDVVKGQETTGAATGKVLASIAFDPKINGFSFQNYGNDDHDLSADLHTDDLLRMFGSKAVCKSGSTAANCVVNASARQWREEMITAMGGGHCEGMAVACLRFTYGMPFKNRTSPGDFLVGARTPFDLKRDNSMLNYIAYYWTTQVLWEPRQYRNKTMALGPVAVVKALIDGMNANTDTFTLAIFNYVNGKYKDGHAVTPFAIEDAGTYYKILVYDNNRPGMTKVITVEKGGKQVWRYVTAANPKDAESGYIGDITTKSIGIAPTSIREGKCFDAPFAQTANAETGCGKEGPRGKTIVPTSPVAPKPTAPPPPSSPPISPPLKPAGKFVDLQLTGDGEMLIIDNKERRLGYDSEEDKILKEIPGGEYGEDFGGMGVDMPHYRLPYDPAGEPITLIFSGADLDEESDMDFVYTGPGFTVGFDHIKLDPGEILAAEISPDGEKLSMAMSNDGEMPEVYYSVDTPKKSYRAEIRGNHTKEANGKKLESIKAADDSEESDSTPQMSINFDDETGKLQIDDNSNGDSSYDVDIEQFGDDGKIDNIELNDVGAGDSGEDNYEIEIGEWDGGDNISVRHDDEGNGFEDDEEMDEQNEDNGIEDDEIGKNVFINYLYNSMGL